MDGPPSLVFVGNRFGTLSRRLFEGWYAAVSALGGGWRPVLADSATARQASRWRRTRNAAIRGAKIAFGIEVPTLAGEWFSSEIARGCEQWTPVDRRLSGGAFVSRLGEARPALVVVAGCDQILRRSFLDVAPRVVNFHPALLPRYRGVSAVEWAFLHRETVGGYTFHTIESEEVDGGRVVLQRAMPFLPGETPSAFLDRAVEDAAAAMPEVLRIGLGAVWPPPTEPLRGGEYFSGRDVRRVRRFSAEVPATETLHRFACFGSLDVEARRGTLKVTRIDAAGGGSRWEGDLGRWALEGSTIRVGCRGGDLRIATIEYLPAALLAAWLPPRIGSIPDPLEERDGAAAGR